LSRFMERRNVDFPQPDGPMRAVTALGGIDMVMLLSACFLPYQKEKARESIVPAASEGL
jgi:hypothetical protein